MTLRGTKAMLLLAALLPALFGLFSPGTALAAPRVERMVLPNQMVLLIVEEHTLPMVTFQAMVDAGSWRDPEGKEGLADLTSSGLLLGTATRSLNDMYRELDFIGSTIEASCRKDTATLSLKTLKKDLDKSYGIFAEVLTRPSFPEAEIKREIGNTLGTIQYKESQPESVAAKAFDAALYLKGPYAHPVEGTKESAGALTREAVAAFYDDYYRPGNAILAIVGDITTDEVKEKIVPSLAAWPEKQITSRPFPSDEAQTAGTVKIDRSIAQANIILGHRGVARSNKDYYALAVMNQILGQGGLTSRMATEIRVKRGLAYAVESVFVPRKHEGSFEVVIQTKNASAKETIDLAVEQMKKIRNGPVSTEELDTAKKYMIGNFPLRFDTQEEIASLYNQMEYFALGLDYPDKYPSLIQSITVADVQRVARQYLHPDECILVVVGDLKAAGME